jgi:hypothetical protein
MLQPTVTAERSKWRVGERVIRKDSEVLGTVLENSGSIKVRWDTGQAQATFATVTGLTSS